jgi:hypothetical protein
LDQRLVEELLMKRFVPWLTVLWLPCSVIWAQKPPIQTVIDWPASSVTVVFAPDFSRPRSLPSKPGAESQTLAAITGIRKDPGKPVEFSAPRGLIGVRAGAESAMASFVEITEGGVRQSGCLPLPAVLERIRKAAPPAKGRVRETSNDK